MTLTKTSELFAFPMPDCVECGRVGEGWTYCEITATSPTLCLDCESQDLERHAANREES